MHVDIGFMTFRHHKYSAVYEQPHTCPAHHHYSRRSCDAIIEYLTPWFDQQKQVPTRANKQAIKKLVQQQIEEEKPIRAPWYRNGPRPPRRNPDVSWRNSSQQHAVQVTRLQSAPFLGLTYGRCSCLAVSVS